MLLQISCARCTLAFNKRINDYEAKNGTTVTIDQYSNFSMEHEGICYRNSKHNPASAEEYQAADIARMLLLDDEGEYLGDDVAIFMGKVAADNDTRAPKAAIREQAHIIGDAAEGLGDHDQSVSNLMDNDST